MIYKKIDISKSAFYNVSEDAAKEFVDHRINKKSPLTQGAFDRALKKAVQCLAHGVSAEKAIEITIDAGWCGVDVEFVMARIDRLNKAADQVVESSPARVGGRTTRGNTLIEDLTDRSWAH